MLGLCVAVITSAACHTKIDPRPFCSVGASEFDGLVDMWNARRRAQTPGAPALHPEGRGNGTAANVRGRKACASGAVTEPMSGRDLTRLEREFGARPGVFAVAMEALVIIVPSGSPLQGLSAHEVALVFAQAPERMRAIRASAPPSLPLQPIGVNSASDRYRWFKTRALQGANFASRLREVPGPLTLVDTVALVPGGIGYARPAEMTHAVRALNISVNGKTVAFSESAAGTGSYPFARYFYFYLPPPGSPLVTAQVLDFVSFAVSPTAQDALRPMGLYPVPPVEQQRNARLVTLYRTHLSSK